MTSQIRARVVLKDRNADVARSVADALEKLGFIVEYASHRGVGITAEKSIFETVFRASIVDSGQGPRFKTELTIPEMIEPVVESVYFPSPTVTF